MLPQYFNPRTQSIKSPNAFSIPCRSPSPCRELQLGPGIAPQPVGSGAKVTLPTRAPLTFAASSSRLIVSTPAEFSALSNQPMSCRRMDLGVTNQSKPMQRRATKKAENQINASRMLGPGVAPSRGLIPSISLPAKTHLGRTRRIHRPHLPKITPCWMLETSECRQGHLKPVVDSQCEARKPSYTGVPHQNNTSRP